jgi:hydrogenase maturation protease
MTDHKLLIAGVGNIFLGDDGFGVEVVRRLSQLDLPGWVRVEDYGIRGMHLAYDLVGADYELTIMIDATAQGDPPGTVSVIELDIPEAAGMAPDQVPLLDAHGMQPDVVLGLTGLLGGSPGRVLLIGCEPEVLDHQMSLSPAVEQAAGTAVRVVMDLIARYPLGTGEELACALASLGK